jgi:ribosome recycling factor
LKAEVEKEKEEGKLTDSDLKSLKEEVDKVNAAYLESESII